MFKFLQVLIVIVVISYVQSVEYLTEKPDYLKSCEIKKPEFTKCSTESIQGLFEHIATGIEGLDSIKSFDPFNLNKIKISQGNSNAVNVKVELSKVKVYGFGKTLIKESQVSPKDYSWITTIYLPQAKIEGDYALQGRILLIPLNGKGKMLLKLKNLEIVMYTKTKLYRKGEFIFYNVTNVKVDYKLNGLFADFTNLFNGNKELEDSTNRFFNENWEILAEALKPVISQTIEDILLDTLQKIFHFVPANFFVSDIDSPEKLYGEKVY